MVVNIIRVVWVALDCLARRKGRHRAWCLVRCVGIIRGVWRELVSGVGLHIRRRLEWG